MLLLMWPAAFQQVAEDGEVGRPTFDFASRVMCWALFPFAAALGIEVHAVARTVCGLAAATALGVGTGGVAIAFWYGIEMAAKRRRPARERAMGDRKSAEKGEATPLKDKIDDVLTEARVVIPGAQALLGFQLIVMLNEGFEKLPAVSKYVHLASLLLIMLSTILLMTPAAYHRIVEQGEDTETFWRLRGRCCWRRWCRWSRAWPATCTSWWNT